MFPRVLKILLILLCILCLLGLAYGSALFGY